MPQVQTAILPFERPRAITQSQEASKFIPDSIKKAPEILPALQIRSVS